MTEHVSFPFQLFSHVYFPGRLGVLIRRYKSLSLVPPYPWGQWLYAQIYETVWGELDGDVVECGVAKGGMTLFLAELLHLHGDVGTVLGFDTFTGIPYEPNPYENKYFKKGDYVAKKHENETDLVGNIEKHIKKLGLGTKVKMIPGMFSDTCKLYTDRAVKFLHIDADTYQSVSEALDLWYDSVVFGGVIVVDDFFHHSQGSTRALRDFCNKRNIQPVLQIVFPYSVCFVKGQTVDSKRIPSLDGNMYSFDFLKQNVWFQATLTSIESNVTQADKKRISELRDILNGSIYSSVDVYRYLVLMESFWDSMAIGLDQNRSCITLDS